MVYSRYGVTLIGVRRSGKTSRVMLNPGPSHIMNYDDRCFYIAISSEEDTAFKKYQEPKKSSRLSSQRLRNQSFITASSVALELHSETSYSGTDRYGDGEYLDADWLERKKPFECKERFYISCRAGRMEECLSCLVLLHG